jgi:folate-binding protein YgfZ
MSESTPTTIEAANIQPEQPPKPTPLTALLLKQHLTLKLETYDGCLTPAFFDEAEANPGSEVDFALRHAVAMDLGWMARISVTGEDRVRWLAGMTTNAVQTLADGVGNYNFVLNAQGRIQGDLYAFQEKDRLVLDTTQAQVGRLVSHLDRFIIMDDVELHLLENLTALGIAGPAATEILGKLGIDTTGLNPLEQRESTWNGIPVTLVHAYGPAIPRFELWFATEHVESFWTALAQHGGRPAGSHATEILRVIEGTPRYGVDILEKHLAQETSQTRALNFSKGCYLGQEIVERIRSRANIHRAIKHFELKGPIPALGVELMSAGKAAGSLSSVAALNLNGEQRIFAVGTIKAEALSGSTPIEYEGGIAIPIDMPPIHPGG